MHPLAARRSVTLIRLLAFVQVFLLVASLFAPVAALATEPSADPGGSSAPSTEPSAEPTAEPTPEATPEPTPAASVEPDPTTQPSPTAEPDPTPEPEPTPAGEPAPADPEPTSNPDPTTLPEPSAPSFEPSPSTAAPTIASDLADYPPGGLVTLTGSNWQPGETVNIFVNDDWGSSWSRNVDVVADADGNITDQFNLPNWFVAEYAVVATGEVYGRAYTRFTDGNVKVEVEPTNVTASISAALYSGAGCSGTATSKSAPGTIGVGSSESVRLDAAATGAASVAPVSRAFAGWTVESGASYVLIPGTNGRSICISGNFNGSRTATASYDSATNAPPVANADSYSTNEDATLTVPAPGVLGNDSDANGDPLTIAAPRPASGPANGSLTLSADGSFTYTPNANFHGTDTFTYQANDGKVNSASAATVTITVNPVDDAPTAVGDSATVAEDSGTNAINVLANDTDVDGGPKAIASVTQGADGSVAITGGGTGLTYAPDGNFCGADSFSYTLNGGSTATVSVAVTCLNDDPVANDDSTTVDEDSGANVVDVLANDTTGPDVGETLEVTLVTQGTHGTVAATVGGGSVTYTPDENYFGTDSFTYTVSDGNGGMASASVDVTVSPVNDAPVADDDTASTAEDTALLIDPADLLAGDSDVDGNTLVVSAVGSATNGTVELLTDGPEAGKIRFVPAPNYNGAGASFEYTVSDGDLTDVGLVTVTVTSANDAPELAAVGDQVVDEETNLSFDADAADVDGTDTLTFSLVGAPAAASIDPATGVFSWTPAEADGPDTFTFDVCATDDGTPPLEDCETITVTVNEVNVAPVLGAVGDRTVDEGSELAFTATATDADIPANTLTFSLSGAPEGASIDPDTGEFSWTPTDDGTYTVTVTVTDDGTGTLSDSETITITVDNVAPVVTAPADQSTGEATSTSFDLGGFTDPGTDGPWSVTIDWGDGSTDTAFSEAAPGAIADQFHTYADDGTYTVTITVLEDGDVASDSATFSVTVANLAPTISSVVASPTSVDEGGSTTVTVTASDPAGPADPLAYEFDCDGDGSYDVGPQPGNSTSCLMPDGDATGMVGVRVSDGDGGTDTDAVDVVVANVAPEIVTSADASTPEGSTFTLTLSTVIDPGQDTVTAWEIEWGDGASTTGLGSPAFTDQPHVYADGPASYTIDVYLTDEDGTHLASTRSVTVVNVAPTVTLAPTNETSVDEGSQHTYSFTTSDPGEDAFALLGASCGSAGSQVGTATFDAATGAGSFVCSFADGPASSTVSVQVEDEDGADSNTATQTVTVANVAPVVVAPAAQSADEGENKTWNLGTFTDAGVDDDPWTVSVDWGDGSPTESRPNAGSAGSLGTASHSYGDNGTYTATVTVTDKDGAATNGTFTVTVGSVAPVASNLTVTVDPVTGITSATIDYSDPGWLDTHTASFTWNGGAPVAGVVTPTAGTSTRPGPVSGAATGTTRLPPGCYQLIVTATITDDDGASHTISRTIANTDVYLASFNAPIKSNERNIAKYGNVVPVKVQLASSCFPGTTTTEPTLHLTIANGDDSMDPTAVEVITATSVSGADTGTQMRTAGDAYIYNLSTKQMKAGQEYTIRVRVGTTSGPIILRALFQPKK